MAHRHSTVAILLGIMVGVLLGAGTVHFAEVSANVLVARMDFVKRSQRTNDVYKTEGMENPGVADSRNTARTPDTRSEKGLRGAATAAEIARGCMRFTDRAGCLEDALQRAMEMQSGN